jgi:hypothetical protein
MNLKERILIFISIVLILISIGILSDFIMIGQGTSMGDKYGRIGIADPTVDASDLESGDFITFTNECGDNIGHRIIKINGEWYTKGDGNSGVDAGDCYLFGFQDKSELDVNSRVIWSVGI